MTILQLSSPLFCSPNRLNLSFITRATAGGGNGDGDGDGDGTSSAAAAEPKSSTTEPPKPDSSSDPDFETRLSKVRLRYRSGKGKKAEIRKTRKGKQGSTSGGGSGMYLPPVPLKEPVSGGLKVDFGFSPYSERVNGRIAIVGLSALVLVELATGQGVINYHSPAIVLIQVYFMAAVSALYVKYEKERVSVWPQSPPAEK